MSMLLIKIYVLISVFILHTIIYLCCWYKYMIQFLFQSNVYDKRPPSCRGFSRDVITKNRHGIRHVGFFFRYPFTCYTTQKNIQHGHHGRHNLRNRVRTVSWKPSINSSKLFITKSPFLAKKLKFPPKNSSFSLKYSNKMLYWNSFHWKKKHFTSIHPIFSTWNLPVINALSSFWKLAYLRCSLQTRQCDILYSNWIDIR